MSEEIKYTLESCLETAVESFPLHVCVELQKWHRH